jgi:hypothetical protein
MAGHSARCDRAETDNPWSPYWPRQRLEVKQNPGMRRQSKQAEATEGLMPAQFTASRTIAANRPAAKYQARIRCRLAHPSNSSIRAACNSRSRPGTFLQAAQLGLVSLPACRQFVAVIHRLSAHRRPSQKGCPSLANSSTSREGVERVHRRRAQSPYGSSPRRRRDLDGRMSDFGPRQPPCQWSWARPYRTRLPEAGSRGKQNDWGSSALSPSEKRIEQLLR